MASLKQITSVTVTSPWSNYSPGANQYSGVGNVLNPSYPIFVFDYGGGPGIVVGYVVGTSAYEPYASATGGSNVVIETPIYLGPIGYNYYIGGGGVCGCSSCYENGSDMCGYWMYFADLTSNTFTLNCKEVNEGNFGTHFQGVVLDLENENLILVFDTANATDLLIWIIPFSGVGTFLSGTMPSNATWAYVAPPNTSVNTYARPALIWNGNLITTPSASGNAYLWYMPLSTIYANALSGTPSSSASPVTVGTLYLINSKHQLRSITLVSVPSSSGITTYLTGFQYTSNTTVNVALINPSSVTVVSCFSVTLPASSNGFNRAIWNSIFLITSATGSTVYVTLIDPKVQSSENLSVSGAFGFATSEGYLVVANKPLNCSSVTFTVYQILADHTYVFQNVSITQSGSTVTATGTLIDESTGSAVAGATVYLVAVFSLMDDYSNDVSIIASGTTNSNGQFTISGTASSSAKFYGVKYVP